jgi:hypothetical protein
MRGTADRLREPSCNGHEAGVSGEPRLPCERQSESNAGKLRAIRTNGVEPETKTIQSGKYAGSPALYFYVKRPSVQRIAGMKDFVTAYSAAIGP